MKNFTYIAILVILVITASIATTTKVVAAPFNPEQLSEDIDLFVDNGAQAYIVWLYSGDYFKSFASDPYTFYRNTPEGDAICTVLKEKSSKAIMGVNMWNLGSEATSGEFSEDEIKSHFTHLANNCGVSVVRVFYKSGETQGMNKLLQIANGTGIRILIALADYSNGDDLIPKGADMSWYKNGYTTAYTQAANNLVATTGKNPNLFGYELSNEAHCRGKVEFEGSKSVDLYSNWGRAASAILSSGSNNIGYGQKSSQNTTLCDSPGVDSGGKGESDFKYTNSISGITITSAHYYNDEEKELSLQALEQSKELGKFFYIGEAGQGGPKSSLEGVSCEQEQTFAGAPACATCAGSGIVEDNRSGWQKFLDTLRQIATFNYKTDVKLAASKNITPVKEYNTGSRSLFGINGNTSWQIGFLFHTTDESFDCNDINSVYQDGNDENIPRICNYAAGWSPEQEEEAVSAQEFTNVYRNGITRADVYFDPSKLPAGSQIDGPMQLGIERIEFPATTVGAVARWVVETPDHEPLALLPPPGISKQEYLGKDYEYIVQKEQQAKQRFLAQNLSNDDLTKRVFEISKGTAKKVETTNTIKLDSVQEVVKSSENNVELLSTQKILSLGNLFDKGACVLPTNLPEDVTCGGVDYTTEKRTTNITIPDAVNCQQALDPDTQTGTGGVQCDGKNYIIEAAPIYHLYSCKNCTDPSGITDYVTGDVAVKDAYTEKTAAIQNSEIQLTASSDTSAGLTSIGFIQAMQALFLAQIPPAGSTEGNKDAGAANLNYSGSRDLRIEKLSGKGNISTTTETIIPGEYSARCAEFVARAYSMPPDKMEDLVQQRLNKCYAGDNGRLTTAYCGALQERINNRTSNYTVVWKNGNGDEEEVDRSIIIDPESDLRIKIANRFVDPGLILNNGIIAPVNPGGCDQTTIGYPDNKSMMEIWYLPTAYRSQVNNFETWEQSAYRLKPEVGVKDTNTGETNLEIDITVNPGFYRIQTFSSPCLRPEVQYVEGKVRTTMRNNQYFELKKNGSTEEDKAFCAKLTRAPVSRNPGGNIEVVRGCEIPGGYNSDINRGCGGYTRSCHCIDGDEATGSCNDVCGEFIDFALKFKGLDLYESIFGTPFDIQGRVIGPNFEVQGGRERFTCSDVFHGTLYETNCEDADNSDIGPLVGDGEKGNNPSDTTLKPPWEEQTPFPTIGIATYYAYGIMEQVLQNRIAWGQITTADINRCKAAGNGTCAGYVATMRKGDMGRVIWVRGDGKYRGGQDLVIGPLLVIDMGAQKDIPDLVAKNFVVDLQYQLAQQFGMTGIGPIKAKVCNTREQCESW